MDGTRALGMQKRHLRKPLSADFNLVDTVVDERDLLRVISQERRRANSFRPCLLEIAVVRKNRKISNTESVECPNHACAVALYGTLAPASLCVCVCAQDAEGGLLSSMSPRGRRKASITNRPRINQATVLGVIDCAQTTVQCVGNVFSCVQVLNRKRPSKSWMLERILCFSSHLDEPSARATLEGGSASCR